MRMIFGQKIGENDNVRNVFLAKNFRQNMIFELNFDLPVTDVSLFLQLDLKIPS